MTHNDGGHLITTSVPEQSQPAWVMERWWRARLPLAEAKAMASMIRPGMARHLGDGVVAMSGEHVCAMRTPAPCWPDDGVVLWPPPGVPVLLVGGGRFPLEPYDPLEP